MAAAGSTEVPGVGLIEDGFVEALALELANEMPSAACDAVFPSSIADATGG